MTSKRILVVDDEYLIGLDIISALEGGGFRDVVYAQTAAEAMQAIQTARWDLVVADANLNGTSAGPLLEALQEERTPFVVVSGYDRNTLPLAAAEAPLVKKPFAPAQLVAAVRLCLRR